MASYQDHLELGREIGLTGMDLVKFADQREAVSRDERKAVRDAERDRLELEVRQRERDADRKAQLEREELDRQAQLQREELDRKAQYELEKLRLDKENKPTQEHSHEKHKQIYKPRIPYLSSTDCLYTYILRFQEAMEAAQIDRDQWVSRLRDLLTGQVLKTFQDLSTEQRMDFDMVKERLLASQNLNAEGFRTRFNDSRPMTDRSFGEFVNSLKSTLSRWLKLSHCESFQQLHDLIIKNKVLETCDSGLRAFLIERDPSTVEDLIRMGEQYTQAHIHTSVHKETFPIFPASTATQVNTGNAGKGKKWHKKPFGKGQQQGAWQQDQKAQNADDYKNKPLIVDIPTGCQICKSWRHQTFQCPNRNQKPDGDGSGGSKATFGQQPTGCFLCGGPHKRSHCPRYTQKVANSCNITQPQDKTTLLDITVKPQVIYPITPMPQPLEIQLYRGFVNDKLTTVMVDSGANVIGISQDLVPEEAYTGKSVICRTFSGNLERYKLAVLFIRTAQFTGWAECCVLRKPVAGIVLGQMTKVIPRSVEEIYDWYRQVGICEANVAMTRAQSKIHERRLKEEEQYMNACEPDRTNTRPHKTVHNPSKINTCTQTQLQRGNTINKSIDEEDDLSLKMLFKAVESPTENNMNEVNRTNLDGNTHTQFTQDQRAYHHID